MNEVQSIVKPELNNLVDMVEKAMIDDMVGSGKFHLTDAPVVHRFTDKLYSRQITMRQGLRLTSKIHLTDHQFIISQGVAIVYDDEGEHILEAPYHGITKAGTRRILYIPEEAEYECIWTTFHFLKDDETTPEQVEDRIIEKRKNPLLEENNILQQSNYKL